MHFSCSMVGRRLGLIVIVDFFPLTIHTDETRHCSGQKWLYGTLHHLIYLERKSRKILITMVQKKQSAKEVIGILLQIWLTHHNWRKKRIFWELPYWKDLLLRHNLDVLHIEKNFFDNIINTLLNVPGKTKDNKNSRLDLHALCSRSELHIKDDGKIPVPIFRLSAEAKAALFKWVTAGVKFSDGYVSNLSKCVEHGRNIQG